MKIEDLTSAGRDYLEWRRLLRDVDLEDCPLEVIDVSYVVLGILQKKYVKLVKDWVLEENRFAELEERLAREIEELGV